MHRTVFLVGALLVAIGLGFLLQRHFATGRLQAVANDAVLVMPVSVIPMDSENAWVRLGAMDYMAARLHGSGINVLPSEQALRLDSAVEGDAPAVARRKLLALSGARRIALPEMRRQRDGWSVRMRVFDAAGERMLDAHGQTVLLAAAEADVQPADRPFVEAVPAPEPERRGADVDVTEMGDSHRVHGRGGARKTSTVAS